MTGVPHWDEKQKVWDWGSWDGRRWVYPSGSSGGCLGILLGWAFMVLLALLVLFALISLGAAYHFYATHFETRHTPAASQPSPNMKNGAASAKALAEKSKGSVATLDIYAWYGFANGTGLRDRDAELRRNCGSFNRVDVPENAGNRFSDLCESRNKSCVKVCDWEGRMLACDSLPLGGGRDGTRVALCEGAPPTNQSR